MSEPKYYQKKPVAIQAMRWDGSARSAWEILNWINGNGGEAHRLLMSTPEDVVGANRNPDEKIQVKTEYVISIATLEGDLFARPGWWVIRGLEGEFYPCKNSVFQESYEEVAL